MKRISEIDVSAGYDIVSINNSDDSEYNRFIEVKAISHNISFFWSGNEYDIARLKGNQYYLYLVYLPDIESEDYIPIIIQNPASIIMEGTQWLVEPNSYKIRHISI